MNQPASRNGSARTEHEREAAELESTRIDNRLLPLELEAEQQRGGGAGRTTRTSPGRQLVDGTGRWVAKLMADEVASGGSAAG